MKWVHSILFSVTAFASSAQPPTGAPAVNAPLRLNAPTEVIFPTVEPEKEPFWRRKPKVWERIRSEREVVVSVKTRKTQIVGFREELYMQGAGAANRSMEHTEAVARRFEDYPKMSSFVRSAQYTPETRRLMMVTQAFNYVAHLNMELRFVQPDSDRREIRFRVIDGGFRGLTGVVEFSRLNPNKTLIALTAQFAFSKLPMPQFFAEFGLEVALKIMASRMRAYVEGETTQAPAERKADQEKEGA